LALSVRLNTESFPNVEHSKMWSELDECALGADLRVIDSTFYFFLRRFYYRATVGREGECLMHSLLRSKYDLDFFASLQCSIAMATPSARFRRHPFRKWFLQAKPQRDLAQRHAADILASL
jgi:hypothetical protein